MQVTEYEDPLSGEDFLHVRFVTERGEIKDLKIILFTEINGRREQMLRIDLTHGFLHKDIFYETKPRKEKIYSELNGKLIESIIGEIKENWKEIKAKYLRTKELR